MGLVIGPVRADCLQGPADRDIELEAAHDVKLRDGVRQLETAAGRGLTAIAVAVAEREDVRSVRLAHQRLVVRQNEPAVDRSLQRERDGDGRTIRVRGAPGRPANHDLVADLELALEATHRRGHRARHAGARVDERIDGRSAGSLDERPVADKKVGPVRAAGGDRSRRRIRGVSGIDHRRRLSARYLCHRVVSDKPG